MKQRRSGTSAPHHGVTRCDSHPRPRVSWGEGPPTSRRSVAQEAPHRQLLGSLSPSGRGDDLSLTPRLVEKALSFSPRPDGERMPDGRVRGRPRVQRNLTDAYRLVPVTSLDSIALAAKAGRPQWCPFWTGLIFFGGV